MSNRKSTTVAANRNAEPASERRPTLALAQHGRADVAPYLASAGENGRKIKAALMRLAAHLADDNASVDDLRNHLVPALGFVHMLESDLGALQEAIAADENA